MFRTLMATFALIPFLPTMAFAQMDHETRFTVRVENVSSAQTLMLSNGETAPAPIAPVFYTVHTGTNPIFTAGRADTGYGLELLAEDGSPARLIETFSRMTGVTSVGAAGVPQGAKEAGPLFPGGVYEFTFSAAPGQVLSFATMFVQSNDLFYAPGESGIALFDANGHPLSGDITQQLQLWDAGTEMNEEPGLGQNQAPRQSMGNTGADESGNVMLVNDGYTYPQVGGVIRVTLVAHSS